MVCSDYRKKRFGFYRIKFFLHAMWVLHSMTIRMMKTYNDNVDGQLLFFYNFSESGMISFRKANSCDVDEIYLLKEYFIKQ